MDDPLYNPEDFRSPAEAVKILGVSPKTIQLWVENGTLRAWKTAGGHRRITVESIMEVVKQREQAKLPSPAEVVVAPVVPSILVVDDEASHRRLYELGITAWNLPLKLETAKDGFEGLIKVGYQPPRVLISDLHMPGMDGFQMIRRLQRMPELSGTLLIIVTAMSLAEIEAQGGLPKELKIFSKPVPFDQLKEYIFGHLGLAA
ncbi:MAG: response regulator [Pseudomonadota bacterium]